VNYVDVCDDVDATLDILQLDEAARARGVTALIGMGASPGVTNLLARFAAEGMLDETDSIDIFHAHGGEPFEGAGVVAHRFHCMSVDIPMFLDGELRYVKYFEPSGIALREKFDFPVLGPGLQLYPYPHPEQITLPRHLKLRQVTNKGTVLPQEYYDLTRDICQLGLHRKEPLAVGGVPVSPHDFAIAFILDEREKILARTGFGRQRGCCSVVARGRKRGRPLEIRFHMASESQALGEGTGLPAALGALLMLEGKVKGPGVMPPEACVAPLDFLARVPRITSLMHEGEQGGRFAGLLVQRIDENGKITESRM
jgi:saccharopine dehydrogenase (NAD+, L-lysine-forming)